jgi:hypothetical protein
MKNYKYESEVVMRIACCSCSLEGYTAEEALAEFAIRGSEYRGIPETNAREILRLLSLQEDRIITIKKYRFGTQYELAMK